jgi:hypothetical protein
MSRICAMCLMFTLGATGCFPAAAADLPKQGDFKANFYGHGTYKGFSVGKTRYESSWEEDGFYLGEGLLNHMSAHCLGMTGKTDQTRHGRSFCAATDIDGDQIMEDVLPEPYQNGAKEIRGVVTFTGGTGKYAGITGEIKFVSYQGLFRSFADNAFEAYAAGEGHYQLPMEDQAAPLR